MNDKPKNIPVSYHGASSSAPAKKAKFVLKEIEPVFKTRENYSGLPDLPRTKNDFEYVNAEDNPLNTGESAVISKKAGTVLQYSTFANQWRSREQNGYLFVGQNFRMKVVVGKGATGPYSARNDPNYRRTLDPQDIYSFTTEADLSVSEIRNYLIILSESLERLSFNFKPNTPLEELNKDRNVVIFSRVKIHRDAKNIDCRDNLETALDSVYGILWS